MKTVSIVIGVVILILGAGYLVTNSNTDSAPVVPEEVESQVEQESAVDRESTEAPQEPQEPQAADAPAGTYTLYDAEQIAQSDADTILLFFHATWCPSCRALDADILANADSIPAGVEIYKLDYDTQTALKRQYGVTTQHSVIEIDATGAAQSSISHPLTFQAVIATL
jgi:thiol-disulfide isomerase/thioredoxin